METIEFRYVFREGNEDNESVHEVESVKRAKNGLSCDKICEMFVDFMISAGFSEDNILDYFR